MSVGCSSLHIPLLGHLLEREHQDSDADEGDAEGHFRRPETLNSVSLSLFVVMV